MKNFSYMTVPIDNKDFVLIRNYVKERLISIDIVLEPEDNKAKDAIRQSLLNFFAVISDGNLEKMM